MKNIILPVFFLGAALMPFTKAFSVEVGNNISFIAIEHASFVILADTTTIFVDPVGEKMRYSKFKAPDIILVTHTHKDHFDKKLVTALKNKNTAIVGPKTVIDGLASGQLLNNGETMNYGKIGIEAIPAYNTTPESLQYHPKGEGNGYVLTLSTGQTGPGIRVYISGDTEDIPEMRALKNIDYAFICLNLPYTMSDDQASSAVLEFMPKVVYPYHFREKEGAGNINRFYEKVLKGNKSIKIKFIGFYK
ncbi:MAG: MBL fold metallo-hydrolase [Elusimicrobia bacterium]|nr:MBL fold metallo-hydrolase [Candidatus Liberimonas magnetica]